VLHVLKKEGASCYRRCGDAQSGWLVLDYVDMVIHILSAEARSYYALEDLWAHVPRIP
jgi:ribosome-associated protein